MCANVLFQVWKNEKSTLTRKIFRGLVYCKHCDFVLNALLSRNFCEKRVRVKFKNFHTELCARELNSLLHRSTPLILATLVPPIFNHFCNFAQKTLPFHDERNCLRLANNHENKASNLIANFPLQKSHWPCCTQCGIL